MKSYMKLLLIILLLAATGVSARYLFDRSMNGEQPGRTVDETDSNTHIPFAYTLPHWYEKYFDFTDIKDVKPDKVFEVKASLESIMTDMNNIKVEFILSDGLKLVDGPKTWAGSLPKGTKQEFTLLVRWHGEIGATERLNFIFSSHFPRQAILDYVEQHKETEFNDKQLRKEFIRFINEFPDRQEDSDLLLVK